MLNTFEAFWDCSLWSFSPSEHHIFVSVSVVEPIFHFFTGLRTEKSHILQVPGVSLLSYFIMGLHVWYYAVLMSRSYKSKLTGLTLFFKKSKEEKQRNPTKQETLFQWCLRQWFCETARWLFTVKTSGRGGRTGIWQRLTRHPGCSSLLFPLLKCRDPIPPAWGGDPQGAPDPRADQPGHSEGAHCAHVPPEAHHGHAQVREIHTVLFWRELFISTLMLLCFDGC